MINSGNAGAERSKAMAKKTRPQTGNRTDEWTSERLARFDRMHCHRTRARLLGGVDEAGRGALAGPVVAACVVLAPGTLLPGVNDRPSDSAQLAELIEGIPCRLNLIPFNPPGGPGVAAPRIKEFQQELIAAGVHAYLRQEKGADIAAACGQLAAGGDK